MGAGAIADREKIGPDLRVAASLLVLIALSIVTWRQIGYWRDNDELWSHTVEVTENNYFALLMVGRADEALPILEKAVAQDPRLPMTHVRLANTFSLVGRQQDAVREYTAALALTTDPKIQSRIYEGLATAYTQLEDFAKVRESFQNALRVDPRVGPEMIQRLSVMVDAQPTAMGCTQLGILLQENGNLAEARAAYEQALQLDPNYAYAEQSLALMTHGGK